MIVGVHHSILRLFLKDPAGTQQEIHTYYYHGAADSTKLPKAVCVHALKRLGLPRASHSGEIALAGSRRLRSTLAAAPFLFAHAVATVAENKKLQHPYRGQLNAHG